jgi:serine/threonine protein kinase
MLGVNQDNVLIADDGRAVLSDFGISRVWVNNATITAPTSVMGSCRWMAPELLGSADEQDHPSHTKASDVWAFGMVVYVRISSRLCTDILLMTRRRRSPESCRTVIVDPMGQCFCQ